MTFKVNYISSVATGYALTAFQSDQTVQTRQPVSTRATRQTPVTLKTFQVLRKNKIELCAWIEQEHV